MNTWNEASPARSQDTSNHQSTSPEELRRRLDRSTTRGRGTASPKDQGDLAPSEDTETLGLVQIVGIPVPNGTTSTEILRTTSPRTSRSSADDVTCSETIASAHSETPALLPVNAETKSDGGARSIRLPGQEIHAPIVSTDSASLVLAEVGSSTSGAVKNAAAVGTLPGLTGEADFYSRTGIRPYYEDKGIVIVLGDCRDVLPTLERVDLVLTDPPYGISLSNHGRRDGRRRDRDWAIAGDADTSIGQAVIDHCQKRRWPIAAFASPRNPWQGDWRSFLVWHKPGVGVGGDPELCWMADWELIQVANNGPLNGPKESAVIRWPVRPAEFEHHPCQKPVGLCSRLIQKLGGDLILDPFMGSGTTLRAAKDLGRRAIGIELEEKWCEVAAKRLSQEVLAL